MNETFFSVANLSTVLFHVPMITVTIAIVGGTALAGYRAYKAAVSKHSVEILARGPPLLATRIHFENCRYQHAFPYTYVAEMIQGYDEMLASLYVGQYREDACEKFLRCCDASALRGGINIATPRQTDWHFYRDLKYSADAWLWRKRRVTLSISFAFDDEEDERYIVLYGSGISINCRHTHLCGNDTDCKCQGTEQVIARIYYKTMTEIAGIVLAMSMHSLDLPAYVLLWIIDFLPAVSAGWKEVEKIRLIDGVIKSVRKVRERRRRQQANE